MIVLARILGVILFLVALLCGGCSIAFAPMMLGYVGGRDGVPAIWVAGLVVAALCIWGGIALMRYQGPPSAESYPPDEKGGAP